MLRRSVAIVVLVMAVLTLSVQTAGAAGEQTWYFTNTDASVPIYSGADYNTIMTKGVEDENVTITLAPGERVWFYADEVAQYSVTFPAGTWNVAYWVKALNSGDSGKQITTRLQGIDSDGTKVSGTTGYAQGYLLC